MYQTPTVQVLYQLITYTAYQNPAPQSYNLAIDREHPHKILTTSSPNGFPISTNPILLRPHPMPDTIPWAFFTPHSFPVGTTQLSAHHTSYIFVILKNL